MHTEGSRFVRSRRYDATPAVGVATHDDRFAAQRRVARLLHGHEECIEVHVHDLSRHNAPVIARTF